MIVTTPASYGDAPLPRRNEPKTPLPSSWVSRSIRAEYVYGDGQGQTLSGKLLDTFPVGSVIYTQARESCSVGTGLSWSSWSRAREEPSCSLGTPIQF